MHDAPLFRIGGVDRGCCQRAESRIGSPANSDSGGNRSRSDGRSLCRSHSSTSVPAGSDCGADAEQQYHHGLRVISAGPAGDLRPRGQADCPCQHHPSGTSVLASVGSLADTPAPRQGPPSGVLERGAGWTDPAAVRPDLREQPVQGLAPRPAASQHHAAPSRRIPRHRRTGSPLRTPGDRTRTPGCRLGIPQTRARSSQAECSGMGRACGNGR